jgi:DNA-binding transcriptional MerR regulator
VEGNDGYKLYDDAAVEKLQQIALYYQLGLKRDEIRDIMLDPQYDSNRILETLLSLEIRKREQADRHIAALEYLKVAGVKNGLIGMLKGISLEVLGQTLLTIQAESAEHPLQIDDLNPEKFLKEFSGLLAELKGLDETSLIGQQGEQIIGKVFDLGKQYMGSIGCAFVLGLFVCAAGEGSAVREIGENISVDHGKAVIRYVIKHPELYKYSIRNQKCEGAKI